MSDEPNPTLTNELHRRTAECDRLARAVLVAGVEAFKHERGALPLDLIMAYVAALSTSIVAFDAVKNCGPGLVDELVSALRALVEVARRDDEASESRLSQAVTAAIEQRDAPTPASMTMRCTNCGSVNDAAVPMAGGESEASEGAFAICALCQSWYRREGGRWVAVHVDELSEGVRRQLDAVARGVARSLRDRLSRATASRPQH